MKQTLPNLQALTRRWQSRLGIADWTIRPRYVRHWEMGDGNTGECLAMLTVRNAEIKILDPQDWQPVPGWEESVEQVLVHELLHVVFAGTNSPETATLAEVASPWFEQAIDSTATLLVRLDKEARLARLEGKSECLDKTIKQLNSLR